METMSEAGVEPNAGARPAEQPPQRPASPNMFRGPAAYVAVSPWRPWTGLAASIAVAAGALLLVGAALVVVFVLRRGGNEVLLNILGTLAFQAAIIPLTIFAATRYGGRASEVLALGPPAQGLKAYPIAFGLLIAMTLVMNAVLYLIGNQSLSGDIQVFKDMFRSPLWWLALLLVGVGAPLSEEFLCRGLMFSALAKSRIGNTGAALVSSAAFAGAHYYSPTGMFQVFLIGLLFSWILVRTGSLRVTMVCHSLYNTLMASLLISEYGVV